MAKKEILVITNEGEFVSGEVNQVGLEILEGVKEGGSCEKRFVIQINQRPPWKKVKDIHLDYVNPDKISKN